VLIGLYERHTQKDKDLISERSKGGGAAWGGWGGGLLQRGRGGRPCAGAKRHKGPCPPSPCSQPRPPADAPRTSPSPRPTPPFPPPKPGKTLDRDFYMDGPQAAEWGIVDEVIDARSEKSVITQ
jgi:hypothetical protein